VDIKVSLTSLLVAISLVGCDLPQVWSPFGKASAPPSEQPKLAPGQFVTLDGYDSSGGFVVQRITLWKDQKDHAAGISATAKHGESVKFIQRESDSVLVETTDGKRGWVSSYFIKGLR